MNMSCSYKQIKHVKTGMISMHPHFLKNIRNLVLLILVLIMLSDSVDRRKLTRYGCDGGCDIKTKRILVFIQHIVTVTHITFYQR